MERKHTSVIIIKISFVLITYLFFSLSTASLAGDLKDYPGELIVTANFLAEDMAISYNGSSVDGQTSDKVTGWKSIKSSNEGSIYFTPFSRTSAVETLEPIFLISADNSMGLGKKIKELAAYVLKYVNIDSGNDDESISHFGSRIENKINTEMANEVDLNLSFNLGYNDVSKFVSINAIKLSSYFLFTHFDAVYDANHNDLDFFLSNGVLNTYFMDDMTLEFKLSPTNSSGAVLLTMPL